MMRVLYGVVCVCVVLVGMSVVCWGQSDTLSNILFIMINMTI